MEIDGVKETVSALNSFDYIFISYTLLQIFHGFTQGFRIMLFETVKWIILIGVIYISNKVLYPYLLTTENFVIYSQKTNEWCFKSVTAVLQSDNPLQNMLYTEIAKSIPYDKIAFFLVIIVGAGILSRIFIIGSVFKKETSGRALGVVFGMAKSLLVTFLVMNIIAGFMMSANPGGFVRWQKESFILSKTGQVFTGESFAQYKDELLEKTYEKLKKGE